MLTPAAMPGTSFTTAGGGIVSAVPAASRPSPPTA